MILLPNQLFFAEVEAMLSEGREVQIRMKGHSMRPLLRSERDQVVLTPCTDPARLRPGDVVLFRCEGRHILHRILRIEPESGEMPPQSANTTVETITKTPEASAIPTAATTEAATTAASATASNAGDTPAPLPALRETGKATPPLPARPENSENPQATSNPGQTPAETAPAPPRLRFTLAGDGNHRMTEHCAATDIAAVMTAVIRPSGRIVSTASRRWRRQSRCWLTLPAAVRRFILRALWRLGIR